MWLSAVEGLDRATVRGVHSHGAETALRDEPADTPRLPLVLCGDSHRNIGLGGGGNLANREARRSSPHPGAFCD